MSIFVRSNNGTVHFAERATTLSPKGPLKERSLLVRAKTRKEWAGYVRKLCDGQWVRDQGKDGTWGIVTCPACLKR